MEWKKYRLGCLSHSIQTGPFGSQLHQSDYSEEGTPVIMPKDIVEGRVVEDNIARVSDIHIQRLKRHKVKCGDVVYSRRGDVGRCALVGEKEDGWLCGTGCLKVELNKEKVLPPFLFYILQRQDSVGWVESHAVGSTMPNLNTGILAKLPVFLPTLNLQHRIASILSTYDTLIENNTKRIHLLEKMAENLHKEWFVRFRFPGHEKVEMENGLPKGWKYFKIEELCEINKHTLKVTNAPKEILYLDTGSITCGKISELESVPFVDAPSRARRLVRHNSIVYSTVRPNLQHYGILKTPASNMVVSTGFVVLDCKYDIANIVYLALAHPSVYKYCSLIADCAVATYPSIKPKEIGKISIALPPMDVAIKWNNRLECFYRTKQNLQHQNTLLARQRDLLLPRLMSGKLEVKP